MLFNRHENVNIQDSLDGGSHGDYNESPFPDGSQEVIEHPASVDDVLKSHDALVGLVNKVLDIAELDLKQKLELRRKLSREMDVVARFPSRRKAQKANKV